MFQNRWKNNPAKFNNEKPSANNKSQTVPIQQTSTLPSYLKAWFVAFASNICQYSAQKRYFKRTCCGKCNEIIKNHSFIDRLRILIILCEKCFNKSTVLYLSGRSAKLINISLGYTCRSNIFIQCRGQGFFIMMFGMFVLQQYTIS